MNSTAAVEDYLCGRLAEALVRWIGTPWRRGVRIEGVGVDCMNLIGAVYDQMYWKTDPTPVFNIGIAEAVKFPFLVDAALSAAAEAWPMTLVEDDGREVIDVSPGDMIVLCGDVPFHPAIAGPTEGSIWHARNGGVEMTHVDQIGQLYTKTIRVYKPEISLWISP